MLWSIGTPTSTFVPEHARQRRTRSRMGLVLWTSWRRGSTIKNEHSTKLIEFQKVVVDMTTYPTQENDINCGIIALFYMECHMNKYKIKKSLTSQDIINYCGLLLAAAKRREQLNIKLNYKEDDSYEGDIIL